MMSLMHRMMRHTGHREIEHSSGWWRLEGSTQSGMMMATLAMHIRYGHGQTRESGQCRCVHQYLWWYLWHLSGTHHGILVHGHVATQCGVAWSTLMLHCILVHAHLEALAQTAGAALIAMRLIDHAQSLLL